jgi:hypothetical protein
VSKSEHVFYFVVHNLRWVARVPGLPHFFDSVLVILTWLFWPRRVKAMQMLEDAALQLEGVRLRIHRFGGTEFSVDNSRELGHLHGHGLLDVAIGRAAALALYPTGRLRSHHVFPNSKWVSFQLESVDDVPFAIELLELSNVRRANGRQSVGQSLRQSAESARGAVRAA